MQKHQDEAEGNSCESTALTTERRISHRATETNLPKFVTAPNKTPLGRPTWPSTIDHTKPSAEWTRTALKLPPPWPVEDARWCEVTASGSVSRFYASDRLTPPQIATLEGKRRQAAILSRKPGATILNSAISPASRALVFEARKKKLGINTVDQRNKANTLGFNPWGMPGNWTDTSDPRNKLCQCKVLCPPRGSDTPSGSHYYHCRRHYVEESTRVNQQPMSIITMINDDWASLKWSRTDNPHKGIPNEADAVNATASESNTIIDTVFDSVTGRAITCLADTGCGPPAVVELQLIKDTQPELLNSDRLVTPPADTFGVGGSKLPVSGLARDFRFVHNNREIVTDALVVDTSLGCCQLILGMPCLASMQAQIFCDQGIMSYKALNDNGNLETRMFGRGTVTRTLDSTPQTPPSAKPSVTIASTRWQLETEYPVQEQTVLCQRLTENRPSTAEYWAKDADYRRWACRIHATDTSTRSLSISESSKQQERLEHCAMQSQLLFIQAKSANQSGGIKGDSTLNLRGGKEQILQFQKSASSQKRPSALNWQRSNTKNVHWTRQREDKHRIAEYPLSNPQYQTYRHEHGDLTMTPDEEKQSITPCAVGHVGHTRYPKSQESYRSGRSANMVDEGGNYVQTTTIRRALEDAIRDFVLHSRAVGSGQPKGYEDPDRTGNHLQRSATNTDYSHFRQFVMKEARKPLYQEMYRTVHGRRIKWLHDVEKATPIDFRAVYDDSQLGDVKNGVDRTPQLVEHDQRCRTPCKCGFPADECQCHNPRQCRQQALKKWPDKPPPLITGMDEDWEKVSNQVGQDPSTSVLQDYVDVPGPASTPTDTLVDQAILAVFQQHPTKAQAALNRQPNLSTQLLTEVRPTDVVMTLSEPAEFEAERLRMDTVGASLGIEDEVNYPGLIARVADDGQSMVLYLEPRANEWLDPSAEEGTPPTTTGSTTTPVSPKTTTSSFPIATTAIQETISKDYEGTSKRYGNDPTSYMKKLVEEAGIARATFVHEPSKWDLENAMKIELEEGENVPPPEYRRMGPNMLAICAEQLKEFLKAGWIYKGAARTAAPVLMVKKPNADLKAEIKWRVCIDYRKINAVIRKRAMDLPDVPGTIHTIREQACESYRQVIANQNGSRTSIHTDLPQRAAKSKDPGKSYLTVTDIVKAFHRVCVAPESQDLTAFCVPGLGVFKWQVAPMGLATSPAEYVEWFTKKMKRYGVLYRPGDHDPRTVLDIPELNMTDGEPSPQQYCQVYIDDIILVACDIDEAVRQVKHLVQILKREKLFISLAKTVFATEWLRFLGYIIGHTATFADPKKVAVIKDILPCSKTNPWSKTAVKSFAGMTVYYRMFIMGYARYMRPLHNLVKDDIKPDSDISAHWTRRLNPTDPAYETHVENVFGQRRVRELETDTKSKKIHALTAQEGFEGAIKMLCLFIMGQQPDPNKAYIIATDASQYACAGALCQEHKGKIVPIEFFSKVFNKQAQRYTATERECLGLKHALENWSWYLLGSKFNVVLYSDHQALQALAKSKINNTRISNWQLAISPYRFTVQYKPGRSAIMAGPDCLSRLLQESWKHYRNNDNEWTTVDFYDEVPAFKQLFEKLESDDRDFLTPKVDTETVSVYQKGGGKKVSSETSAIFEIQQDRSAKEQQSFLDEGHERPQLVESLWDPVRQEDSPPGTPYDHAAERQNAYKYQQAIGYGVHTIALDPYGTTANDVMYMAEGLPLDFDDSTPDKGAIHGAQGRLKGDMYNASNNDMPVSIAKRFNINLKKLLHNNSMQHPGLKAKSKLKANTPIILQNRVIGERTMQGATMIELPRLNIADIKIKPTDYEGTCYESAYHDEKVAEQSNMLKVGKILYYHHAATGKWRIVLPTKEQQHAVVQEVHGYAEGHLKPWRMREIISPKYYWRGLKDTLKQYQQECEHCNRHDNRNQVPALGYYSVWETPLAPAMAYAMDLITDLPPAGPQFDCVLVITDRYSRYTIAIPTYKSLTGEGAARLFFEHVVLIHGRGLPISIFSDRDPRFISAFFTEFFVLCGVKLSTTSGYRSTSNGLVERRNQDLEGRLRGHAFEPQKWLDKLPLAVYHINSTTCRTLGVCPIEAERGYKPRNPLDLLPGILADLKVHPTLKERLDALQQLQQEVEENIDVGTNKSLQRVNSNKRDANKKTVHYKPIKAGDMVWLSSRDVTVPAKAMLKSKKLTPRFFGPYQVERFDAPATVKLKWTNSKSKVWPFFHVSRIRPYQGKVPHQLQLDGVLPEKQNPPEPIEIEYEVQRILAHRNGTEQTPGEYLVQWKGFNFEDCTWEPRNKLASAPLRIKEYHERLQRLENHDPSVQQDYGHGVLMVHKTSKSTHSATRTPLKAFLPIVVRNIWEQYELQLQQLINSGLRCKELE